MIELEERIRGGLRQYADVVAVTTPPFSTVVPAVRVRRRGRPVLVAAAVLAVLALVPWLLPATRFAEPAGTHPPRLPRQFASFSFLTSELDASPIDRAIAVYLQRNSLEDWIQRWQPLLLDADGDRYRQTRAADRWPLALGYYRDSVPYGNVLLSPDGRRLAIASGRPKGRHDVSILDVSTAAVTTHTLPATDARPLAWSPDARRLAYVSTSTESGAGTLGVLDVDTGHATEYPALGAVIAAAYCADGSQLVVQAGSDLVFLDAQGTVTNRLTLPPNSRLAGPAAWSPNGSLLAIVRLEPDQEMTWYLRPRALDFLSIGVAAAVVPEIPMDDTMQFQGWRTDGSVVFWQAPYITEVAIVGGARTVLAELDGEVVSFQVASDLIRTAVVVKPGPVDRGPWPWWVWLGAGLVLGAVTVPVLAMVWYVRRRRRRSTP
jgi:hypothetical protein